MDQVDVLIICLSGLLMVIYLLLSFTMWKLFTVVNLVVRYGDDDLLQMVSEVVDG